MIIQETIAAGGTLDYAEEADFFRVLEAGAPMTVIFYARGREVARAERIGSGYSEKFAIPFDRIKLQCDVANAVSVALRYGNTITYDQPPNGAVNGSFSQQQATVTAASGQLLAANTTRRYLLIQNNALSGDIFVRLDGAAATVENGIKVEAGGSLELQGFAPTGAVTAIGNTASNAAVIVIEA